ncbi:MAG: hypothetical protein ROM54_11140 [Anaerobiospirillum sp.]|nr:hypothetical protein [Anaerobiospirillum sp.]
MVGFQRRVGAPKPGLPGQPLNPYAMAISAASYQFDGTLKPGDFAFASPEKGQVNHLASKTGSHLLGIVVRSSGSYCAGAIIPIAVSGAIYAAIPDRQTPSSGQAVLCDPASGEVTYGKTGDPNDTGWKVLSCDPGNGLVVYEKL